MKVCLIRLSTDLKLLAEALKRQKLMGGTRHNDTAVILIILHITCTIFTFCRSSVKMFCGSVVLCVLSVTEKK